ncbi:hypothetical protein K461DRAFT_261040 [Myriangium duriaei CBS 260.36]|uniref:DBF4-type domain-containing protein n=1 Tax=Myriangium duriaei CBS 260.36 TaxID=1168546 RepID=A0A9P4MD52_9PEZI|nr:hypothetical protein K461DRAFT_261040 [Myriangium duriaei CBS 260.36]
MAAASVQPSPRSLSAMASARIPLASNQNAINSPFRGLAPISGKRTRPNVETSRETAHSQPPAKKLALDIDNDENIAPRTLTRQSQASRDAESRLFMKKPGNPPMTAFEKKLREVKITPPQEPQAALSPEEGSRKTSDGLETIRQWQRHYRKAFPTYVFYFESVPEETRQKMSRLVQSLGAKEEKFFSKTVTHVVTTRTVPSTKSQPGVGQDYHDHSKHNPQQRTIDPALLDRSHDAHLNGAIRRTTDLLDSTLQARATNSGYGSQAMDHRRMNNQATDILTKAKELDIKIWALEKLQRMMTTMFNTETGEQPSQPLTRSHATANLGQKHNKQADLQRLLRNEKVSGPADRDMTLPSQDMVQLRGFYIYVHDMDERTRPVMVRDYPKVANKEQGKWPQFRLSSVGRCPFVEDAAYARKLAQEERKAEAAANAPRTRTRTAAETNTVLAERQANLRRSPRKQSQDHKPLDPPKLPLSRQGSADGMPSLFGSAQANMRANPRYIGGEPVASGVQPSNITSAIRSQIISSTAISSTAPGARAGSSKELHALKRKVLERGATITSGQTLTSSYMNDVRAALNGDGGNTTRVSKRKAQDTLGNIREEAGDEDEAQPKKVQQTRKAKALPPKDPKPGYCENCRDKFDDFDDHILSRKHRKFALTQDNWTQLDDLLAKLVRPLKHA